MTNKQQRFFEKHVLVTGGARGLGLEIAIQFAKEGAAVTIFDSNSQNLKKSLSLLTKITKSIRTYEVDVGNFKQVTKAVSEVDSAAAIDILVNNAGIAMETPFLEITPEEWKEVIRVNLTGMFNVAQSVCIHMAKRKKGLVINMGSKNGLDGESGYAHYNASKGGVVMLTKTMALELAQFGIRVNTVCPGYIQTPMSKEIDSAEFTNNFVEKFIPLGRPGQLKDVAPMFLFLASEESSFITGQTFVIDGGQLAGQNP